MTHYELLGVAPDASAIEVRDAYRRAARRLHPDAAGQRSSGAMAEINQAWWVLRDPERRRAYDLTLPGPSSAARPAGAPSSAARSGFVDDHLDDGDEDDLIVRRPSFNPLARYQDPPRFPWRFMAVLAAIGIGVVLLGVALDSPVKEPPPDNLLIPGSCVVVQRNGDVAEVNCSATHDGVVVNIVAFDEFCEAGLQGHRDRQGLGIACIQMSAFTASSA